MKEQKLSKIRQQILDEFGSDELQHYNSMSYNDRSAYTMYMHNHKDSYVCPSQWTKKVKKKENKLENYVKETIGSEYIYDYKELNIYDRVNYYLYLYQRKKYNKTDGHLTPMQWLKEKELKELNVSFDKIAEKLNISAFSVKEAYKSAMEKIREIIKKNPKYQDWREMLQ